MTRKTILFMLHDEANELSRTVIHSVLTIKSKFYEMPSSKDITHQDLREAAGELVNILASIKSELLGQAQEAGQERVRIPKEVLGSFREEFGSTDQVVKAISTNIEALKLYPEQTLAEKDIEFIGTLTRFCDEASSLLFRRLTR